MISVKASKIACFLFIYCKDLDGFLRQLQGHSVVQDGGDGARVTPMTGDGGRS